ncbi:gp60 [Burkholderia aenigmatica]|uniref:helix-turn-helix domain-containing protein n=1 Tax=Burkholderia aenigmatica TaxID=2015348 RepID=UPI001452DBC0|nr:helix-turn-helix domain-containing protein [Burkholderia aenigmatica]VWC53724.1 gp60 [Burkholderia aenigmatica]
MSVKVMTAVFERYPEGGGEMLLALALADHADDDGTHIFPSVSTMAAKTRQSERAVQYQLAKMQETGWLILVRPGRGGRKGGMPAEYRISTEWIKGEEIAPISKKKAQVKKGEKSSPIPPVDKSEIGAEIAPNKDGNGCNPEQKWVQSATEMGAKLDKPYKVNHQLTVNEPSAAATRASGVVDNPAAAAADQQNHPPEQPNRETELSELLVSLELARGKQLTIDPSKDRVHLLTWIGKNLTDLQLRDAHKAAAAARKRDSDDRPTYVGFVATFIAAAQSPQAAPTASDGDWFLTPEGCDAKGAELGAPVRKPDEHWHRYRVIVAAAARDPRAIEFVLKDAQRFNAAALYQFARATFGDALMPVDDYAS